MSYPRSNPNLSVNVAGNPPAAPGAAPAASVTVAPNAPPAPQAPNYTLQVGPTQEQQALMHAKKAKMSNGAFYGLIFLVVLVIAIFVFYLMKPSIVMKKIGDRTLDEIDWVKVLIGSVIVAILITALVWLFRQFVMKE